MINLNFLIKKLIVLLPGMLLATVLFSQVPQIENPILKNPNYISISVGINYTSPEYRFRDAIINGAKFTLLDGVYQSYQPAVSLEIGHAFKIAGKTIKIGTGLSVASYSLMMSSDYNPNFGWDPSYKFLYPNSNGNFMMTETFVQVPLFVATSIPLVIAQPQARYHALELKFGGYYGSNIKREIQSQNAAPFTDQKPNTDILLTPKQYGTFTLLGEIGLSFTAPNGHSHQFGLKGTYDTGTYIKTDPKSSELPFLYNSIGVFYRWVFCSF